MSSTDSISLTDDERTEVCALVSAGLPLPDKYRERLFARPDPESSDSCGAREPVGATLELVERFPANGEQGGLEGWENLILRGDNLEILGLLQKLPFCDALKRAGGIKLIYMDPPFDVGFDFNIPLEIGGKPFKAEAALCAVAFHDSWGIGEESFGRMLFDRLCLMREILAEDGSIYVHCDWRTAPRIRHFMDYIFGAERFLGEIVWHYTGGGRSTRYFSRKHDLILHYARSNKWTFNLDAVRVPYKKTSGYGKHGIVSAAGKHYTPHPQGTPVDDVWDLPIVNPMGHERLSYPTQKPETLLERIILASSNPGDLVADFFCGSGTTAVAAEKLGRKWLAVDSGAFAVHTLQKRLLGAGAERRGGFAVMRCAPENEDGPGNYGQPRPEVRVTRQGAGFSFELRAFSVPDGKVGEFFVERGLLHGKSGPLMDSPLDWVDYWSVSLEEAGQPVCVWQSFRTRRDREMTFSSPCIPVADGVEKAVVRIVDVFANEQVVCCSLFVAKRPEIV